MRETRKKIISLDQQAGRHSRYDIAEDAELVQFNAQCGSTAERRCSEFVRNQTWFADASQNDAATEARMPAIPGAANDRSRGNNNRRARGNDDRTIRAASSELVAMKARPTAALGSGAINGDE